jgi:hypothetical protein
VRTGHLLFSAIHFLVIFFLIALGVFLIALPYAPHFRFFLTIAFTETPQLLAKMGWGILGVGLFLFITLYFLNRRHFIQFQSEGVKISVDERVIKHFVHDHVKILFPEVSTEVVVRSKGKLEIIFTLPSIQEDEETWQRVENELSDLLVNRLGYQKEFYFTLASR